MNYVEEHRFLAAYHRASRRTKRCYVVVYVHQIATVFPWKITCGGFQLEGSVAVGGAQSVEKNMSGERPTGYWWYEQVTVPVRQRCPERMRRRTVCVCVCQNLINALELLANQQKDGDSPIQSIVTGFCERSRKGIMEGLRNIDKNGRSLCSGRGPSKGRSFEVRKLKFEEECPEVSIREGPEELTLRTDEVGSKKKCVNVDHIAEDRWRPSLGRR